MRIKPTLLAFAAVLVLIQAGTITASPSKGRRAADQSPLDGVTFILAIKIWRMACDSRQPLCQQALAGLAPVMVSRVKFNAKGKAQIPALSAGTYYLIGSPIIHKRPVIWDLRIDLKPGANSVTLGQRNATPTN